MDVNCSDFLFVSKRHQPHNDTALRPRQQTAAAE